MMQHSQLSDECVDEFVELFFLALPAMDGPELAVLLNAILRIIDRERRRAMHQERERWARPSAQ